MKIVVHSRWHFCRNNEKTVRGEDQNTIIFAFDIQFDGDFKQNLRIFAQK